eukprot:TRINITY_DN132_c0_g1_i1.p1 TRINITY_DN132_c0_g1~~TRINITY_DN132_c0_g1_i1.p1  ORF type:complete len:376 (-),score=87.06 TRINITY_DN132_c0_g1_i1:194-1321(-)
MCIRDRYQRRVHGEYFQKSGLISRQMLTKHLTPLFRMAGTRGLMNGYRHDKPPVRVAITGAGGAIGYNLMSRISAGECFGRDQPVILHLIDLPNQKNNLLGESMELHDCGHPQLIDTIVTDNLTEGFRDVDYIFLVGGKAQAPGQSRYELIGDNGRIFRDIGKAINDNAKRTSKTIVVANPCDTLALIVAHHAKNIPRENINALSMLDHLRTLYQLAKKTNSHISQIKKLCVWGNHSSTMFPDITHTTVAGRKATELVDQNWVNEFLIPTVQSRAAEVQRYKGGHTSVFSAANAALVHMRLWAQNTDDWVSFNVYSKGNPYGIDEDLYYSFPVTVKNGRYEIVQGLQINEEQRRRLKITEDELIKERESVRDLLK